MLPLLIALAAGVAGLPRETAIEAPPVVVAASSPFVGQPKTVATVRHMHAARLAVAPDGQSIYVAESPSNGAVVDLATGTVRPSPEAPAWAASYWSWKSGRANPADPSELIDLSQREVIPPRPNVSAPDIGGSSMPAGEPPWPPKGKQEVTDLTLRHTVIGTFENDVEAGLTFGWAPDLIGWMAYRDKAGHLATLDLRGRTFTAPRTHDVWLPAWTPDGSRILFVEQHGDTAIVREIQIETTAPPRH